MSKTGKVWLRRWLSGLLVFSLIVSLIYAGGGQPVLATYNDTNGIVDIKGHWAEKIIKELVKTGVIKGYPDNTFRPDAPITRAEIAAILNNLMQYQAKSKNKFSDLSNQWYADAILGANASGIIVGNDNKVRPEDTATREEAALMLARALAVKGSGTSEFTDSEKISEWAVNAVNAMAERRYINGLPDGSFNPKANITRAELVTIISNGVKGFYSKEGTYIENVNGTAVVNTPDVILKDIIITGDLILAEGIGNGDITLDNVTIKGDTIVRGGGENSIIIKNSSKLGTVTVCRIDGKVSVKVQDGAEVEMIIIDDGSDDVTISGEVGNFQVDASNITVTAKGAVLSKVVVSGKNTTLILDEKSSVNTIAFNKEASNATATINGTVKALVSETVGFKVKGDGKLETAEIKGNDNKIEVVGAKVTAATGVTGTFAGTKAVETGTSEIVQKPSTPTPTPTPTPPSTTLPESTTPTPTEPSTPTPTPTPSATSKFIVRDEQPQAVVVLENDAGEVISRLVNTLVEYVKKSTGAELPKAAPEELNTGKYADKVKIYIGVSAPGEEEYIKGKMVNLDPHGFLIHSNKDTLTIIGPTQWGAQNGTYDFLERYVGVRWLLPGPNGEDVPKMTSLPVPGSEVREEPAFTYRMLSPFTGPFPDPDTGVLGENSPLFDWAARNKLQGGYNETARFMHNLYNLFSPAKYNDPVDFYSTGSRPGSTDHNSWQINFTDERTVDVAVERILKHFDENPNKGYYSLGINDNGRFLEAIPGNKGYSGKINSIGLPDVSDAYYKWVNDVVTKVVEKEPRHKDKKFGVLAYMNVMDPPSFPLHPQVIPQITKDRMTWIDDEIRAEGYKQMEAWAKVASSIAWYDYMYGYYYVVPRIYHHMLPEIYQYAAENKVMGIYTEIYSNAGDGPKIWLASKLQWNPYQDVDVLLDEWYDRAVGAEAAPDLEKVYDLWEKFWMEDIKDTPWFKMGKVTTYLSFEDPSYTGHVPMELINKSMGLLASVVDKAMTEQQKERARIIQRAFEYYKASILAYPKEISPLESETEAVNLLNKVEANLDSRIKIAQSRYELMAEFKQEPALIFYCSPNVIANWSGYNGSEFWRLVDYMKKESGEKPVTAKIKQMEETAVDPRMREYANLIQRAQFETLSSNTNPSFESGGWASWAAVPGGEAKVVKDTNTANRGESSYLFDKIQRLAIHQTLTGAKGKGGLTALRAYYKTPANTENGSITITIHAKNGAKNLISYSCKKALSESAGEWAYISMLENIPEWVDGQKVDTLQILVWVVGKDTQVYVDDVELYQPGDIPDDSFVINQDNFWQLADQVKQNGTGAASMRKKIEIIANRNMPSEQRTYAKLLLKIIDEVDGKATITKNSSFLEGNAATITSWSKWSGNAGEVNSVVVDKNIGHTDNASCLFDKVKGTQLYQNLIPKEGLTAARAYYKAPADTTTGTIEIILHAMNGNTKLKSYRSTKALSASAGEWVDISMLENIPGSFNGKAVTGLQVVINVNGNNTEVQVNVDDVVVYQAPEETLLNQENFWQLADAIENGDPVMEAKIRSIANSVVNSEEREYAKLLVKIIDGGAKLTKNSSFDEGIEPWTEWSQGLKMSVTNEVYHTGVTSPAAIALEASSSGQRGGLEQYMDLPAPGPIAVEAWYYTPEGTETGLVKLEMNIRTADNSRKNYVFVPETALSSTAGKWTRLRGIVSIPGTISVNGEEKQVVRVQIAVTFQSGSDCTKLYIDDFAAWMNN